MSRGDRTALNLLLQTVQVPIQRYLAGRLSSWPDADDLAGDLRQEVLIRAAFALPRCRFETDQRLLAWVLRIARHVLIDHVRAERARRERMLREGLTGLPDDISLAHWRSGGAGESRAGLLEAVAAEAMETLPECTSELLRLRVQLGWTWKEVGLALGTTEAAAKRRFQRAQAALRKRFLSLMAALPPATREAVSRATHNPVLRPEPCAPRAGS